MKSESTGWKLPVLIGVLVTVALLINYFFFTKAEARREAKSEEQRQAAAAAEARQTSEKLAKQKADAEEARQRMAKEAKVKAAETEAAEHARLLARYLNSGFTRNPGAVAIGVAVESEGGTMNPSIANALAQHLRTSDVQLLNSFFKPEFVADRYVANIFSGDTGIFDRLELTNSLNAVLVGRQSVSYSTNTALEKTVTANLRLEVMALPVNLTRHSQSWNFAANGIGFRPEEARQAAEDRIIEQIAKNTNMVLAPRF